MKERALALTPEQAAPFMEAIEATNRALDNARIAQQVAANEEASFGRLCRALGIKPSEFRSYDKDTCVVTLEGEE